MCGRYLIDDEAFADMYLILNELIQKMAGESHTGVDSAGVNSTGVSSSGVPSVGVPSTGVPSTAIASGEIFPTNIAPVISGDGVLAARWGFTHWKNTGVLINARAETALEKVMFKKPLLERRCVIPSSGFYEWSHSGGGKGKQKDKFLLREPGETKLYMAGMLSSYIDSGGLRCTAFIILTTAANDTVAPLHDRMPVIVAPDEISLWIDDSVFMEHVLRRAGPGLVPVQCG